MDEFPIVLLHLSDLHFGWDRTRTQKDDRHLALTGLRQQLRTLEADWRPNAIAITGNIRWRGSKSDYAQTKVWLDELMSQLRLDAS
jgi:hypothetical protein